MLFNVPSNGTLCFSSGDQVITQFGFDKVHYCSTVYWYRNFEQVYLNASENKLDINNRYKYVLQANFDFDFVMLVVLTIAYRLIGFLALLAKTYRRTCRVTKPQSKQKKLSIRKNYNESPRKV